MKPLQQFTAWLLILQFIAAPALVAQPVLIQPGNPFNQQPIGSGVENLRVSQLSPDGTEAQLTMDYSYDGLGGPIAQLLPVIGKRGQQGVSSWFGSDPVTVGRGRGTVTVKVRYFNDEPGVPPAFTSDQVRILILNQTGTAVISAIPFLKTIKWGNPNAKPEPAIKPPQFALLDKAKAEKLAQEKRLAEAKAKSEAEARAQARLRAEAEVKARREAEEKARAEALAREEDRKRAQAEAARIAQEKRKADELRLAQEKARAEELKRTEAEERARQEAARALADANARAEAKKRADAETKRREEERRLAEAKRVAEEKAREEARLQAEAEARRLDQERAAAEAKAVAEAKARKEAEDRAWREAQAQAKAELEANKLAAEKKQAEAAAAVQAPSIPASVLTPIPSTEIARDKKTKVTNVDVVNRSLDRSQMTFGVEFEYKDRISNPVIGVDVLRQTQPEISRHFNSTPAEIGKSRRNFALIPVRFQPATQLADAADFSTDQVMVYLSEKSGAQRYNIYPATMLLRWRAPGSQSVGAAQRTGNSVEIEDFKQNDPSNGIISVRYNLAAGRGKIRARISEAANPASATYFSCSLPEVNAGNGLQLIDVAIDSDARTPSDLVRADTITLELVDLNGKVLATAARQAAMVWARPRE